jgi:alpha-L-fucosidase
MFIHWEPYSLASVEASWPIMRPTAGGITEVEYRELPKRFNPTKFDPHAFVDLARSAGQKYIVFTTKHHDGFCMFDTSFTDYKITNTPYGKDIAKQLANACKERGMPLGSTTRHRICIIQRSVTHRSWQRKTGTVSPRAQNGLSIWTTCSCD